MKKGGGMMPVFSVWLEALLLVIAVSVDAFVASFSYGMNRIKIPTSSRFLIDLICSGSLVISMLCGTALGAVLPQEWIRLLCFSILFILGLVKLFDGMIKTWISRRKHTKKQLSFHLFSLHMILQIYADATEADCDSSRTLSLSEAAGLAVALSLDSIAAGVGAGANSDGIFITAAMALAAGFLAVCCGEYLGKTLRKKIQWDLSWISGALLIILAFCKL